MKISCFCFYSRCAAIAALFTLCCALPAAAQGCDTALAVERWSEPVRMPDKLGFPSAHSPFWTYDGERVYYCGGEDSQKYGIRFIHKTDTGWTDPVPLPFSAGRYNIRSVCLSPDNKTLYFTDYNGISEWDVFVTNWNEHRKSWGPVSLLDVATGVLYDSAAGIYYPWPISDTSKVNTFQSEETVSISADGERLYVRTNYYKKPLDCDTPYLVSFSRDQVSGRWINRTFLSCDSINHRNKCGKGIAFGSQSGTNGPTFTKDGSKMYLSKGLGEPYGHL